MQQEHFIFKELRRIAPAHFRPLKYCPGKGDYMVEICQSGYHNLSGIIPCLLKLCMCITVTEEEKETGSDTTASDIPGIIYQILPGHEKKITDNFRDHFHED